MIANRNAFFLPTRLQAVSLQVVFVLTASQSFGAIHYVNLSNPSPVAPYVTWDAAATNIQDAVDAAIAGDDILVTNGVYQTGARAVYGMSNRVAVTKPVTVRSVNGPAVTSVVGSGPRGPAAVRCVYLTNGALFAGFTLTNGATQASGDYHTNLSGGGVWCETSSAVVSNCVLTGNSAGAGGGAYSGTLDNCMLAGNSAISLGGGAYSTSLNNCTLSGHSASSGGGAYSGSLNGCTIASNSVSYYGGGTYFATLNNCTVSGNSADYGGGVCYGTLSNCRLTSNAASYEGGGASGGTLNNCVLSGNSATNGGGAAEATLNNCTLAGNSAVAGGGAYYGTLNNCTLAGNSASSFGGGASDCSLYNCIVYYNIAPTGGNYDNNSSTDHCCTTPLSAGNGNFTNIPLFVSTNPWSNLRLQASSPCINAGDNADAPGLTDLDGNSRITGGTVDRGAYEFQSPQSIISYAWLQQFGLATDGSADYADTDSDGLNNWQEWVAGTDPTNAASALRMLSATWAPSGATVTWSSVTNRSYALERATNLRAAPAFSLLQDNIAGWPGSTSWTDTDASGSALRFYRVRVEQ